MQTLWHDLRIGFRVLWKDKSFTALSVFVLALGICGVTAQFSVVNAALIRGLPFPEPERLMRLATRDPSWAPDRTRNLLARDLLNWSREQKSFEGLAGYYTQGSFIVTVNDVPQRFSGSHVTGPFFALLGVRPIIGRDFTPEDDRLESPRVTIISDALWKSQFGGDPNILNHTVRLNGKMASIVGVMPPGFGFPRELLWMPMYNENQATPSDPNWTGGTLYVLGRLKSGISMERAAAEFTVLARRAAEEFPKSNQGLTEIAIDPLLNFFVPRDARQLMILMLVAVSAVLLIACLNVMNMQFTRATLRMKELAVRSALGATRSRLVAQMLAESLIIAAIGGLAGTLLSRWAIDLYTAGGAGLPAWMVFELDGTVLGFTVAATGVSVLLAGLAPAFLSSRANAIDALKAAGRGQIGNVVSRLTGGFVIGQIALTTTLLVASLLLVKSVANRYALDFGFSLDSLLAGRMNFTADYTSGQAAVATQRKLLDHLRASPEFSHAAFSTRRNSLLTAERREILLETTDNLRPEVWAEFVSDGYFETLGLKPLEGREFDAGDVSGKPAPVLVNRSFARKYFPGRPVLGQRLKYNPNADFWCTVVGIVPDTLMQGPMDARSDGAGIFLPSMAMPQGYITLAVRPRAADPARYIEPLRREILKIDPNLAIYSVETPKQALATQLLQVRTVMRLFSMFGGIAIVLSAVGLYGVAAFSVSQRTQEFGIRMALGALPRQIMEMVMRQGILRLVAGGAAGLALTLALTQVGSTAGASLLYKVEVHDPAIYALVVGLLALATLVACFVPARRATKVDPMVALRNE